MEKKALTYTLEIEHHDDGYLAYFPALPGCHTWGKTYEAAVRYAEEALTGYLETLAKHGDPIPVESDIDARVSLGIIVRTPVTSPHCRAVIRGEKPTKPRLGTRRKR